MRYHTAILKNEATGRFHSIAFREAPRPSDYGEAVVRHKSIGHHTEGFATVEEASAHIAEQPYMVALDALFSWDGADIPAMTLDLPVLRGEEVAS